MNEENQNQGETGAAIDSDELNKMAADLEAEQAEAQAGELMEQREGPATAEMLFPLVSFGCDLACPNYHIQKAEKQALAESYGELVDKYFPEGIGAWGVELNALLVTAAIFGPRVAKGIPARAPKEKEPEQGETVADED